MTIKKYGFVMLVCLKPILSGLAESVEYFSTFFLEDDSSGSFAVGCLYQFLESEV